MGRFGKPLRAARVTAALDSVRYLLHLEQLGEPPLQQREWWPVRGSYAAAYLSANARTHRVTPSLCHRTMGFDGVIFAWDLWNEMHPVQGQDHHRCFEDFIEDVSPF